MKKIKRENVQVEVSTSLDDVYYAVHSLMMNTSNDREYEQANILVAQFMRDLGIDGDWSLEAEYLKLLKKDAEDNTELSEALQKVIDLI